MKDFLYSIGETIMMNLDEVKDVTYPADITYNALLAETQSGKKYVVTVTEAE